MGHVRRRNETHRDCPLTQPTHLVLDSGWVGGVNWTGRSYVQSGTIWLLVSKNGAEMFCFFSFVSAIGEHQANSGHML